MAGTVPTVTPQQALGYGPAPAAGFVGPGGSTTSLASGTPVVTQLPDQNYPSLGGVNGAQGPQLPQGPGSPGSLPNGGIIPPPVGPLQYDANHVLPPGDVVINGVIVHQPSAPGAPPGTLPNPDQQYVDAFNASIGRQRQAIDNQLAASMHQLGARRDAAAAVIAGMPAQFAAHYKTAGTDAATMAKVMGGTVGGRQAVGANANDTLAAATLSGGNAAANSTVPILNLGNTANYGAGVDTLNAAHMTAEQNIESQQTQFDASMASGLSQVKNSEDLFKFEHTDPNTGVYTNPQSGTTSAPTRAQLDSAAVHQGFANAADLNSSVAAINKVVSAKNWPVPPPYTSKAQAASPQYQQDYANYQNGIQKILNASGLAHNHAALQWMASHGYIPKSMVP